MLATVTLPGCSGCWRDDAAKKAEEDEAKKKKKVVKKPKPNYEMPVAAVLPNDPNNRQFQDEAAGANREKLLPISKIKPGHWGAVSQVARANNFDFLGELRTSAVDVNSQPLDIEHTNFRMSCQRPASLPKGQARSMETFFFLPRRQTDFAPTYSLRTELQTSAGGTVEASSSIGGAVMSDHEFFFVVLAANPSSYSYLDRLDSVTLGEGVAFSETPEPGRRFYDVSLPRVTKSAPLPTHPLAWTMIAYLVWDDVDPAILTSDQQQAMVDWLHWGGQIIFSGPNTLDKLKGSFLAPYLPCQVSAAAKFDQEAVAELSESFSVEAKNEKQLVRTIRINAQQPLVGVGLQLHSNAQFVPLTGKLVAERRVGGGRTVATAFSLTDLRITKWRSFDNFFNACLLRRPAREFGADGDQTLRMHWSLGKEQMQRQDPRVASMLRYFSRDVGYLASDMQVEQAAIEATRPKSLSDLTTAERMRQRLNSSGLSDVDLADEFDGKPHTYLHPKSDDWHFNGYHAAQQSGVAGWNDFSAAAEASRQSLRDAAGIKIPRADFVLKTLGVYLFVLVPVNWLVFWLLGRVEWAWIAAPVIAIIGALAIIRLAQLDIGFARSRTEIAILELQGEHGRGHLTRYMALYTSLATRYQLTFDDSNALALPFSDDPRYVRPFTRTPTNSVLLRDETIALGNVQAASNSTVLVHSEQMLPVAGGIVYEDDSKTAQVLNRTAIAIREVGVLRKTSGGVTEAAYIKTLDPQSAAKLTFRPITDGDEPWAPQWDESFVMSDAIPRSADDKGRVRLARLVQLASRQLRLTPGDVRLIGWTDQPLPGVTVYPEAPQTSAYTLVVAHLERGQLPSPKSDLNVAEDFKTLTALDAEEATETKPSGATPEMPPPAPPPTASALPAPAESSGDKATKSNDDAAVPATAPAPADPATPPSEKE